MRKNRKEPKIILLITLLCVSMIAGCGGNVPDGTESDPDTQISESPDIPDENADPAPETDPGAENPVSVELPEGIVEAGIFVSPIEGLSDDFIRGMDISSLIAEEASGVKYYDAAGQEQDLMVLLRDAGINSVRVRVWNDPADPDGHGYGGGNCTADTAAELGRRAAAQGMSLCVDFHYSDFWADPNKQMRPKAWNNMRTNDQKQALYDYTCESLRTILDAGADVSMVQIGNEINHGLSGRVSFADISKLLKSASEAVRAVSAEYGRDIKVAVHYTEVDDTEGITAIADRLAEAGVDYDVFGVSYYPYWHGTMDNLVQVLKDIHSNHGVDTCIMETSYMYTGDDGDGSGNSVSAEDAVEGYPVSVQGQATCIRDVCAAAHDAGALGVYYWEGAWIPVPAPVSGTRADIWEEYGSGWASSYAAEYDPDDAGRYYGGCSWENQALFDFDGHPLESLDVFKYLKYGAKADTLLLMDIKGVSIALTPGDELVLPDTIEAVWNDPDRKDGLHVEWDADEVAAVDTSSTGEYRINGYADMGEARAGTSDIKPGDDGLVGVTAEITITNVNLLRDPSFEDDDHSPWTVISETSEDPTDYQNKSADAHTGDIAFHFWSESPMEFRISQDVTVEKAGSYCAEAYMQGGDFNDDAQVYLEVIVGEDQVYRSDPVMPDGWLQWKIPRITGISVGEGETVTVAACVKCNAKSWATFDDFYLSLE